MEDAERRLAQEITRLGRFAHVHDDSIDAKRDVPPAKHGCMDVSVTCSIAVRRNPGSRPRPYKSEPQVHEAAL
jgi:hypothetical protein